MAGHFHSCAEGSDGNVYCWGYNVVGQLGDGTTTNRLSPVKVSAPASVTLSRLSAGDYHTCANGSDGQVYCWGRSENGQLGDGSEGDRATPAAVTPPAGVELSSPSVGFGHVCAVGSRRVYCWGNNTSGQVGYGTRIPRPLPTIVAGVTSSPMP